MNDDQVRDAVSQQVGVEHDAVSVSKWRPGQAPWMFFDQPPVSSGRVQVYDREWEFTSDGTNVSLYKNISAVVNNEPTAHDDPQFAEDREVYEFEARIRERRAALRQFIAERHRAA